MVEWLLTLLEAGLKPGDAATAKEWERLFGPKDSAVVVLQKLVHLLGQLQMYASRERQAAPEPRLSAEERALVKEWLASSGSHAAHPPAP